MRSTEGAVRLCKTSQARRGAQGRLRRESAHARKAAAMWWSGRGSYAWRGGGHAPSPPPLPLPFPKLRSSCSPQRGPRAATLQFGEGKREGRGKDDYGAQNAAGLVLCYHCLQAHAFLPEATTNSATGTRTRVARVRAEYPNQLDYSGCT